jgi:hypothetical protein
VCHYFEIRRLAKSDLCGRLRCTLPSQVANGIGGRRCAVLHSSTMIRLQYIRYSHQFELLHSTMARNGQLVSNIASARGRHEASLEDTYVR